ncbi:DUF4431 domain-containing protein [Wukongibacter sp. M2B1]|uniref:DUF4431 domain-containing protein n=1 Tax=Wukongibacter sp. M2B1 TaxID=3088895 RepID=UPI003D79C62D
MVKIRKLLLVTIGLVIILTNLGIREKKIEVSDSHREILSEPNVSILEGILITRMYYGPPGFGENPQEDKKEYPFILQLDQPIKVSDTEDDEFNLDASDISEVQLVVSKENIKIIKEYKNKHLKVEGTFFSAHTGHHHTKVLLHVSKILN